MSHFTPKDVSFADRCRDSFGRQPAMALIGAVMTRIEPGYCCLELSHRPELTQQHGFFHGGIVSMMGDSAAGYAAYSLFPAGATVLTVEFKLNLMAPGQGERLIAEGKVIRSGRTLTICDMDIFVELTAKRNLIARGMATLMCLEGRADTPAGFNKT